MSSIMVSSDVVNSNNLNQEKTNITCKNQDNTSGRVWSGFKFNNNKIEHAKCGNLKLNSNVHNIPKGTELTRTCDCEMTAPKNGSVTCPNGKFLSTYYPDLKKGLCCSPCTVDGSVKAVVDEKNCYPVIKSKNIKDVSCPSQMFIRSGSVTKTGSMLSCCGTKLKGSPVDIQESLNHQCDKMKIPRELCSNNLMNKLEGKCTEYGITDCNYENVRNTENKCNSYGMRYFDTIENKYKNTDSSIQCHVDNFDKLDKECNQNNVQQCNVYNIKEQQANNITSLQQDVVNIDSVLEAQENTILNKVFGNNIFLCISLILCLIILGVIIYFVIKNNFLNNNK